MTDKVKLKFLIRKLADADQDFVSEANGVGFSTYDSIKGHRIAETEIQDWTMQDEADAYQIIKTHQKQLGLDRSEVWHLQPDHLYELEFNNCRVSVFAPYDAALIDRFRDVPTRKYNAKNQSNSFHISQLETVREIMTKLEIEFVEIRTPDEVETQPVETSLGKVSYDGSFIVFETQYNKQLVDALRICGKWNPQNKTWRVRIENASKAVTIAREFGLTLDDSMDEVEKIAQKKIENEAENLILSTQLDAELEVDVKGDLRPFQKAGVKYLLKNHKAMLADSMGLGKTIQAIATCEAKKEYPAIVICPNTLKRNWLNEIKKWTDRTVQVIVGGKEDKILPTDYVIINYDIVSKRLDDLERLSAKVLVLDESHKVKELKTIRTKAVLSLSKTIDSIYCLTGTPILSKPRELVAQLAILGKLQEFGGKSKFEKVFCGGYYDRFGWHADGATNLPELQKLLRSKVMIRREKEDVLTELPAREHSVFEIQLDTKDQASYDKIKSSVAGELARKAALKAQEEGVDYNQAFKAKYLRLNPMEALLSVGVLKREAAKLALPQTIEFIESIIESEKVIVFADMIEIVEAIATHFGTQAVKVRGGVSDQDRENAVTKFQNDPNVKVFVGNFKSAAEGLTLTQANKVVFAELDWTPAIHDQAIDRCYGRVNDPHGAIGYYIVPQETLVSKIFKMLEAKRSVFNKTLVGKDEKIEVANLGMELLNG